MRLPQNRHLTYCTNIYTGEDWKTTFSELQKYVPDIKKQLAPEQWFGLGLRLSHTASTELGLGDKLSDFKKWLDDNNIYVFTMNGFPYGNFHDERVKDMVHAPDWTTDERVAYTNRLFDQLSVLLPEGMEGGISTSPISYKYWHDGKKATEEAFRKGAANLTEIILHLYTLEAETGKYMHLDIEPEPDGMLENTEEVLHFFSDYLVPIARSILINKLGIDEPQAVKLIYRFITVCYDICHFSLAFEEPEDTFAKFSKAGIKIGKIQVSAALKILSNPAGNDMIWQALSQFNEPTYLHQVTEKKGGKVSTYNEQFGVLHSTQDHILKVVDYLKNNVICRHLEIETYTWDVLPIALKKDLSESIVREIEWLVSRL